ncbi:MAG: hypothetical protein ACRDHP_10815 [Ktedonobacterales bacterium]
MAVDMVAAFTEQMAQLRQAIADADPLAAGAEALPFAQAVAGTFARAPETERLRYLLRALDDAIAAQEIAARLADELHGAGIIEVARAPQEGEADPLRAAYQAYAESQPAYATLYQYRNALALRLRVEARPIPDAAGGVAAHADARTAGAKPPTKPRRPRKETGK